MLHLRRTLTLLFAALLLVALFATAAVAAPDRTVTFSATSTAAAWDGSGAFGFTPDGIYECRVGGVYNCDDTLVVVKDGGTLKASASTDENFLMNFGLYKATADGAPDGDPLVEGELGADISLVAKGLAPGDYVLRMVFRLAANAAFTAKASFAPTAPPVAPAAAVEAPAAPAPAAPAAPAPAAPAPAKSAAPAKKKLSCKAKAKKIKNAKKRKAALKRCAKKKKPARRG